MESGEVLALGNPAGVERPSTPLKARWRIVAADTCELCATRQKVKASAICFVLPSRLPLELGGEGSADTMSFPWTPFDNHCIQRVAAKVIASVCHA